MTHSDWYERMATAMKQRDRARLYIQKWTDELDRAETTIRELTMEQLNKPFEADNSKQAAYGTYTVEPVEA